MVAAFKPFAGIEIQKVQLTGSPDASFQFGDASGHDAHCRTCGSLLYSSVRDHKFAHVSLGSLVDLPSIRPSLHIYVGSKASWYEITDDLPQFLELPD